MHVLPRAARLRTLSSRRWASVLCRPGPRCQLGSSLGMYVALDLPRAELGSREAWAEAPCLCLLLPPRLAGQAGGWAVRLRQGLLHSGLGWGEGAVTGW